MIIESLRIWERLCAIEPLTLVKRGCVEHRGPKERRARGRSEVVSGRRVRGRHDGTDQPNEAVFLGDLSLGAESERQALAQSWLCLVITIITLAKTFAAELFLSPSPTPL